MVKRKLEANNLNYKGAKILIDKKYVDEGVIWLTENKFTNRTM